VKTTINTEGNISEILKADVTITFSAFTDLDDEWVVALIEGGPSLSITSGTEAQASDYESAVSAAMANSDYVIKELFRISPKPYAYDGGAKFSQRRLLHLQKVFSKLSSLDERNRDNVPQIFLVGLFLGNPADAGTLKWVEDYVFNRKASSQAKGRVI
jgi:hypothetical protein